MERKRNNHLLIAAAAVPALIILAAGVIFWLQNENIVASNSGEQSHASITGAADEATTAVHKEDVGELVRRLEVRLKENPNDADGWRVLAWSRFRMQKFKQAVGAYRRASKLDPKNGALKSLLGEALVAAANGKVTPEAQLHFVSAVELEPTDARARYFLGQARLDNGDVRGALRRWIELLKSAPFGDTWTADLRERIIEVSNQAMIDVSESLPPIPRSAKTALTTHAGRGPTAQDIKAAHRLSPEARQSMAHSMVERLENRLKASPKDADGWIMLMRSRMVLNQPDKAKEAFNKALGEFTDAPQTMDAIRRAARTFEIPKD